jgi:MSHA biogenesis protein MshM
LTRDELQYYLNHRLAVAGYKSGGHLFNPASLRLLYKKSRGVPRLINILAHKAMLAAYGKGKFQVDTAEIAAAAADTKSVAPSWLPNWRFLTMALFIIGCTTGAALWMLPR